MTVNRGDTSMTRTSRNGKRIGRPSKVQGTDHVPSTAPQSVAEAYKPSDTSLGSSQSFHEPDDTQLKAFLKAVYRDGLDGRHRDLKTDVEALRRLV
jgi:hypothetical protein